MKSSLVDLRLKQVSMAFCLTAVELQLLWLLKSSFSGGCCILQAHDFTFLSFCFIFGEITTHLGTTAAISNLILPSLRKRGGQQGPQITHGRLSLVLYI